MGVKCKDCIYGSIYTQDDFMFAVCGRMRNHPSRKIKDEVYRVLDEDVHGAEHECPYGTTNVIDEPKKGDIVSILNHTRLVDAYKLPTVELTDDNGKKIECVTVEEINKAEIMNNKCGWWLFDEEKKIGCSVCGVHFDMPADISYCPYCGANNDYWNRW